MPRTLKQKRKHKDKGRAPQTYKIKRGVTRGSAQIPPGPKPVRHRLWSYE